MTTDEQKDKEFVILSYIYQNENTFEIEKSENPDFILRNVINNYIFGVEITEYYLSGSNARVKNIPTYIREILFDGNYRHKEDKKTLALSDITISRDGKPYSTIKGIFREGNTIADYLPELNKTIISKNKSFESYNKNLDHINLIIYDNEYFLNKIDPIYFFNLVFTPELLETIINSSFREIFFITKYNNKLYYVPLKLYVLISKILLFQKIIKSNYIENDIKLKVNHYFILLHSYLIYEKLFDIKVYKFDDCFEIIYGNNGLVFKNEQRNINIENYNDVPIIRDIEPLENTLDKELFNEEFINICNRFKNDHTLSFKLTFDIK